MPKRAPRVCSAPGCGRLIRGDTRRCPEHPTPIRAQAQRQPGRRKGIDGAQWRAIRKDVLARDPVCRMCGQAPSTHCDHIVPRSLGGGSGTANLQGLCHPCHSRKTAKKDGGYGNPKRT